MSIVATTYSLPPRALALGALAASALFGASIIPAHAAPLTALDILTQFNAVIANDFTSTSDVEGRLVANTMTGGSTFYNNPRGTAAASSFGVVNAINITSGVSGGNVDNGGNVNWVASNQGRFNLNGGGSIAQNNPAFAISAFTTPLNALVTQLAGLTANSTVNAADPNNFTFNENPGSSTAVFTLTTAQLPDARNIKFSGSASTIIIDVTGSTFVDAANFNVTGDLNRQIIWNFEDATSLSFSGWHGTVLAEYATVSNTSAMEGDLYALNFNGGGELHDFTFDGTLPSAASVPEPASAALLGIGLLGIATLRRRRR